ncbi:phage tail tube protein [Anaerocolumna xylanovorans]|uniref:Phage tail tube protein n=1 Tax=Anaerocolumna xylanovorans DSM 12503 TaxID=1121345 RepID=A0A1M7Y6B3_9FIRM|nr:phage tail tube protein [Anaerocolumna xylanovorans]SHO48131.1 Phage tail tube protein [Anaerocolumna xylanovorans DSM 12503]
MTDQYLRLADTISAKEGTAFIIINGVSRPLFEVSALKAQLDLTVQSRKTLGNRMTQHKIVGAEGTGSMTMYFMDSDMLKLAVEYLSGGKFGTIDLKVTNEDPQSSVGKQEVILKNVLLKTIPVVNLDDQSDDPITVDTDFTFDGIDKLKFFNKPEGFNE